ncbi:hypothetical protein M9434_007048 [Picochlorum sp. BPE23]|nr:hypothetical protein M9434_007048 [Picochlorum sp. BPE23]
MSGLGAADELSTLGNNGTCFGYVDAFEQTVCEAQNLNITNPPSIYGFVEHPQLWSPTLCYLLNVTLANRVHIPGAMNYCIVPSRGYDAFLFVGIALIAACLLFGKLSTVYVLVVGALLGILHYYVDMLQLGNSITQWLSVAPSDLFLYAFLPPLIVEQAIHIEFYMFRKMFMHSIMLAVVMVILTAIILTPLILFVLGFQYNGWTWVHGALFAAIIAPTDALAVSSILKKAHGPAILTTILEGESLLNDATGITLFQVFEGILDRNRDQYSNAIPTVWSVIPTIIVDIIKLSAVGVGIGLGFSVISLYILRWLRWRGAGLHIEAVYVLAMAYLTYYVTNAPAGGSGVIAVVTFGLFGNWMSMWGMTGSSVKTGEFKAIWEAISFAANGLVFFWAGVASLTYVIRAISQTPTDAMTFVSIPLIYIFMLVIRTFCIAIFNPIFHLVGKSLSVAEIMFTGWSGLRGAVSLILVSSLSGGRNYINLVDSELTISESYAIEMRTIKADMSLWTAWFVVLTLVVNGPCIAPLLSILKLNTIPEASRHIQATAKTIILDNTKEIIQKLRDGDDDDELLSGADWDVIAKYVDLSKDLHDFGNVEDISEVDDDSLEKGTSETVELDQNSLWSVVLVLGRALWNSLKRFVVDVFRVLLCSPRSKGCESQDSQDSSSQQWGSSDESTPAFETLLTECPFQSEQIIDEKNSSFIITQGSSDIETGSVKYGLEQTTMSSIQYTDGGGIDDKESDFDQVCLAGSKKDDLFNNLKQARKKQHRGSEADAQGKDFSDPRLPSSGNFQGTQIQQARTLSSRLIQGQVDKNTQYIRPDNHPEYNELVQYLADVNNSSQASRSAELRGDSSHGSMEQRTLNSITGEKYRERFPNDPTERMTSYSRKVDLFGRAMTETAKDSNSTTPGRAQEDSAERPTVISHSLRGHAHGRNGTPRDFSTLKGPGDVSNRLRTISDMSEITDSNDSDEESGTVNGKESNRAPDAATGMRQDGIVHGLRLNTLQEIRSRITEGLKTRFHESRHLGKISDEAFRILVGACDEKMEITSYSKIGVWDILVKKISRSLITQVIASLALHGSIKFKSANPIVKKVLHYPYALAGILCRRYLGRRVLLGCEVAIEYNLALNSSSHVQWLRLHGDYTLPLLEEVELESQRSYNFIIEREIEAPDTFRAIQSYRAGIVVMKKMLDFLHEIHAQGIINHGECEFVCEKVGRKLQRLEVVGPIWRPPRYKDGIRALKPFATLEKDIFNEMWETGTIKECKPGEIIFRTDDMSASQGPGIIYIMHGVAKQYRRLNSVEREKFCGPESCIGVLQALHLTSLRGTESLVASGNALGRGPAIFHIPQDKVDEIMLRAEKGSRVFLRVVQGWIKAASLHVFYDLEAPITLEILKHIKKIEMERETEVNVDRFKSPFAERSIHANAPEWQQDGRNKSIGLHQIFSQDFIGVDGVLPGPYEHHQESIRFKKATNCVQKMAQRLKKSLNMAHVLHFEHGESIQQDCTMILMVGHLKTDQNVRDDEQILSKDNVMRAPAAIPWMTEVDEQALFGKATRVSKQSPITWKVMSKTALMVVYPNPPV